MHVPITSLSFILMLLNPLATALQNKCEYSLNHNLNQIVVDLELHDLRPANGAFIETLLRDGFGVDFDKYYYNAAEDQALTPDSTHAPLQISFLRQVVQDPPFDLEDLARGFVYEICAPRLNLRIPAPISLNLVGCERVAKTAEEWSKYRWIREHGHGVGGVDGGQEEGEYVKQDPDGRMDEEANVQSNEGPRIKVEGEQNAKLEDLQDVKIED